MKASDFYIAEAEKILKGVTGPVIVKFNNLVDTSMNLYYEEAGRFYYFTLKSRVTHYAVRFNSVEGFRNFLNKNTSLFNRGFVAIAYINKKSIIINPVDVDKTQKRRDK